MFCFVLQTSVETSSVCEEETSDGQQSPEQAQQLAAFSKNKPAEVTTAASVNNSNVTDSREKEAAVNLNSSFVPGMMAVCCNCENLTVFV